MKEPISEVFNCDCIEYMRNVPDKFFDLAIVDPPYGINISKRNGSIGQKKGQGKITKYKYKEWDSEIPNEKYFNELFRISYNQIIWGANYFVKYIPVGMGWIIYDKLQPEDVTFAMAELAYTSYKISTKIFKTTRDKMQNCVSNNENIGKKNAKINPAQKPIELYAWTLDKYAKKNNKIFDSHMGSQSSRIAAYKMGFDYWGCELDEDYFRDGCARFEKECHGKIVTNDGIEIIQQKLF